MNKIKPFILPAAILFGILLHDFAVQVMWLIPYLIFAILLLNFSAVDLLKLKLNKLDCMIMLFQTVVSIAGYILIKFIFGNDILADGWLMSVLCPVASSVVVVAASLGADRNTVTGYTIYGNMLVAIIAPIIFALIDTQHHTSLWEAYLTILGKISSVIVLPFFVALFFQKLLPKVSNGISRIKGWAFPIWAVCLFLTLGQTIDYIIMYYNGNEANIIWLGVIAVGTCFMQFGVGKRIGARYGEKISAGQMLGQKNSAIGIWMTVLYLSPLASVVLAFYSIAQNLFNSWQIWRYQRKTSRANADQPAG